MTNHSTCDAPKTLLNNVKESFEDGVHTKEWKCASCGIWVPEEEVQWSSVTFRDRPASIAECISCF